MIYLHHYPASLFSEKIRLLLGHYGLEWHSVEIPSIMPRPHLMPLSGGYRRTPVLQIGANVYSDTKIICAALARHVGDSELYRPGFAAHRVADWADKDLFRIGVALNFRPEALGAMMGSFSAEEAAAFAQDRAELTGNQPIAQVTPAAALALLRDAMTELDSTLGTTDGYLFGAKPCIADFALYHNVWFLVNNPVNANLLDGYANLGAWRERMQSMGHGSVVQSDGEAALSAARSTEPTSVPVTHSSSAEFAPGDAVSVTPIDYGCIPVSGSLIASGTHEVIIARETDQTGLVHNHFPQAGFEITRAD